MKNKIRMILLSAVVAMSMIVPAFAAETVTEDDLIVDKEGTEGETALLPEEKLPEVAVTKGSITVTLEGSNSEGVALSCLKIADIKDGKYVLIDAGTTDLNNLKNADDMEKAAKALSKKDGTIVKTDAAGVAEFGDLDVGVYVLKATDTAKYDNITPFLISIPTWDEVDGTMKYEITVQPKHTPKPETPEKPGRPAPSTNLDSPVLLYFGCGVILLVALVAVNVISKKRKK